MTTSDLIKQLAEFPPETLVKVFTNDGNGYCHEDPVIGLLQGYTQSNVTDRGWSYEFIETPVVIIE